MKTISACSNYNVANFYNSVDYIEQYLKFWADCGLGFMKKSSLKGFCHQNKRLRTPDVSPAVWSQSSALCFFTLLLCWILLDKL